MDNTKYLQLMFVWKNVGEYALINSVTPLYQKLHHILSITLLLGSKAETVLLKQLCYTQTKEARLGSSVGCMSNW